MIYAKTVKEVEVRHKAFLPKWRLKCQAVADSLDEAGPRLFTFLRYPPERCPAPRPPACCSGRCSPAVRSPCAASMAGTPSTFRLPSRTLVSPPELAIIVNKRCAVSLSYQLRDTTGGKAGMQ